MTQSTASRRGRAGVNRWCFRRLPCREAAVPDGYLRIHAELPRRRAAPAGMVDAYNIFNNTAVLAENTRYGSSWLRPTSVLDARLLKFGVQMNF